MKTKFNIWRRTKSVIIKRNDNIELEIHTKDPAELEKYLRALLPLDYNNYMRDMDIQEDIVHTSEWWINLVKIDDEIRNLFSRAIPRRLNG